MSFVVPLLIVVTLRALAETAARGSDDYGRDPSPLIGFLEYLMAVIKKSAAMSMCVIRLAYPSPTCIACCLVS